MKKRNVLIIPVMTVLICALFTTCQNPSFKNPIIEKWWEQEEEDFDYIPIVKNIPYAVYETIEIDRPGTALLQRIDIVNIEFIIFAGESIVYNGGPGRSNRYPPQYTDPVPGSTPLTDQEKNSNIRIVSDTVQYLNDDPDLYVILHGHANPVLGTQAEANELNYISTERARDVQRELSRLGFSDSSRVSVRGYGGGRNISGSSTTYAGLNRRVEVILFKISNDDIPSTRGTEK